VYDVTFVTQDGQRCSVTVNSGYQLAPVTNQPHVGDRVEVRYGRPFQACAQVDEASAPEEPVILAVVPLIMFVAALAFTYMVWWRKKAP
jgi:hypothetical protein